MSKLVIVLFAVLTVVASKTVVKVGSLPHYHQGFMWNYITNTENYVTKKYNAAVGEHNKLKEDIKEQREQIVANSDEHINIITEQARQQIENLKDGVELLDDEACLYHAAHLQDKAAEASANLTNCISNKSKISTDIELGDITDAVDLLFSKTKVLRIGMDSCTTHHESDDNEASRCLIQINSEAYAVRSSIDEDTHHFLAKIRDIFVNAEKSLNSCEKEYDESNYFMIVASIVHKVDECFKTGAHAHYIPLDPDV